MPRFGLGTLFRSSSFLLIVAVLLTVVLYTQHPFFSGYYEYVKPYVCNSCDSNVSSNVVHLSNQILERNTATGLRMLWTPSSVKWKTELYHNKFCVLYDFWKSKDVYRRGEHITLLLHSTVGYMEYLEEQAHTWDGGISIALFVHQPLLTAKKPPFVDTTKTSMTLQILLSALNKTLPDSARDKVSLHMFFEKYNDYSCPEISAPADWPTRFPTHTNDLKDLGPPLNLYPINAARNIARLGSHTEFFISGDIEQVYSENFEKRMYPLAKQLLSSNNKKMVLIHRRFEVSRKAKSLPKTKAELKKLYDNKISVHFHHYLYPIGHQLPNINEWFSVPDNPDEPLTIFGNIAHLNQEWEPQFVGNSLVPFHDERFPYRYKSNAQMGVHLCFENFTFAVVNNVFTTHWDIVYKTTPSQHYVMALIRSKGLHKIWGLFIKELRQRYPNKTECKTDQDR